MKHGERSSFAGWADNQQHGDAMKFGETEFFFFCGGITQVCLGSVLFFFAHALASMVDPSLTGWDRWSLILANLITGAWPILIVGSGLVVSGITLVVRGIRIKLRERASHPQDL
jgi:hypothetical protein